MAVETLRLEHIEYVNVPRAKLFDHLASGTVFDHMPNTVSNRIIRKQGNVIFREMVRRDPRGRREAKFQAKDELIPPARMITTMEATFGRVVLEIALESEADGRTKVGISSDIRLKGVAKILLPFVKGRILASLREETRSWREYVEKEYGNAADGGDLPPLA